MTIKARGNSFMVSVGTGAERVRKTLPTIEEAQAYEKELMASRSTAHLASLKAAERGDITKTIGEARDRALREVWANTKGESTAYRNSRAVCEFFGYDTPVPEITTERVDEWLDEMEDGGNTGATINRKLSALMVILRNAKRKGWLNHLPESRRRKESIQRMDTAAKLGLHHLLDFIPFSIDTGFRRSETLKFRVDDFDGEYLRLHEGETKNDAGRVIPATDIVKEIILKAKARGQVRVFEGLTEVSLRAQWDVLRGFLNREKDPKCIVHVLRHTCATRLAINGASAVQIQAWMGHKAIQTSIRYIHLCGTHLTGVAQLLTRKAAPATPALKLVSR